GAAGQPAGPLVDRSGRAQRRPKPLRRRLGAAGAGARVGRGEPRAHGADERSGPAAPGSTPPQFRLPPDLRKASLLMDDGAAPADEAQRLERRYAELKVVPVPLSREEVQGYYEDFCNGVLWPLLHYLIGQLPLEFRGFDLYEAINRRFADAVVAAYQPGDLIW